MIKHYLEIIRPPNVITTIADILAGISIPVFVYSTTYSVYNIMYLIIGSACLYSGGIVFNDILDIATDTKERPKRPLPSKKISLRKAIIYGLSLFSFGTIFCYINSKQSAIIAIIIILLTFTYNAKTKKRQYLGAINMGLCRSLNFILGVSIANIFEIKVMILFSLIPLIFVSCITLISHNEVNGNSKSELKVGVLIDIIILCSLLTITFIKKSLIIIPWIMIIIWGYINLKSKYIAIIKNNPQNVQECVKKGVLSLIIINSIIISILWNIQLGIITLTLFPLSLLISKKFYVT